MFVGKPLATTVEDARRVIDCARANEQARHRLYSAPSSVVDAAYFGHASSADLTSSHESQPAIQWRNLGTHKNLMNTTSPIVDCSVHYVDVMCQITDAKPVEVRGMGLRLSDEIKPDMYNYGHLPGVIR